LYPFVSTFATSFEIESIRADWAAIPAAAA
jgi:hypothetical protein